MKGRNFAVALVAAAAVGCAAVPSAGAANIIEEWASVKPPAPPELKPVTLDPKTTALLMLDFLPPNCGVRPRCVATVPAMKVLLGEARAKGVTVMHTVFGNNEPGSILPDVAPRPNEPWVKAFADKFLNTDLEKMLKEKGIQTVIVVGTAANGAILYVGSGAALRGMKVVVPVDGISAVDPYAEQFTVWQLANLPTFGTNVTITKSDMIKF